MGQLWSIVFFSAPHFTEDTPARDWAPYIVEAMGDGGGMGYMGDRGDMEAMGVTYTNTHTNTSVQRRSSMVKQLRCADKTSLDVDLSLLTYVYYE